MIGRCLYSRGAHLGVPSRGLFYGNDTEFQLVVDKEYPILGMSLFQAGLTVLVCDETGKPNRLPVGLFDLPAQVLPTHWEFVLHDRPGASGVGSPDTLMATWGYRELVRNSQHGDLLIDRDPEALHIFYQELKARTEKAT